MDIKEKALQKHYEWGGKIEVISRAPIETREDLSLAYTPGVAQPCLEIAADPELSGRLSPALHQPVQQHKQQKGREVDGGVHRRHSSDEDRSQAQQTQNHQRTQTPLPHPAVIVLFERHDV